MHSRNTPLNSVSSLDAHADTYSTGWPCYCSSYCCVLKRAAWRTTKHILRCCWGTKISEFLFETWRKLVRVRSCSFTDVRKYTWLHSSQYNKKPHLQQPGTTCSNFSDEPRLRGRVQKLLPVLPHFLECTLGSSYLPCQLLDQWKISELEQNYGIPYRQHSGRGSPNCRFDRRFGSFFVGKATQVTPGRAVFCLRKH